MNGKSVDAFPNRALLALLPRGSDRANRTLPLERCSSVVSLVTAGKYAPPGGQTPWTTLILASRKLCQRHEAPVSGVQNEDVAISIWPVVGSQAHTLQGFTHDDVSVESPFGAFFATPRMPPNAIRLFLVPVRSTFSRSHSAPCPSDRAVSDVLHPIPGPPVAGANQVAAPTRPCRFSVPACLGTESP